MHPSCLRWAYHPSSSKRTKISRSSQQDDVTRFYGCLRPPCEGRHPFSFFRKRSPSRTHWRNCGERSRPNLPSSDSGTGFFVGNTRSLWSTRTKEHTNTNSHAHANTKEQGIHILISFRQMQAREKTCPQVHTLFNMMPSILELVLHCMHTCRTSSTNQARALTILFSKNYFPGVRFNKEEFLAESESMYS